MQTHTASDVELVGALVLPRQSSRAKTERLLRNNMRFEIVQARRAGDRLSLYICSYDMRKTPRDNNKMVLPNYNLSSPSAHWMNFTFYNISFE